MKSRMNIVCVVLAIATLACAVSPTAHADSGTWLVNPLSGDWNTAANWSSNSVPNGSSDIGTFDFSNQTDVSISAPTTVSGIVFDAGANGLFYNVTCQEGQSLSLVGTGITNNSGTLQTLVTEGASSTGNNPGVLTFSGSAGASDITIVNNGGLATDAPGGMTIFQDNAHAPPSGLLIANGGVNGGAGGLIEFDDQATGRGAHVQVFGNGTLKVTGTFTSHQHTPLGSIEGDGQIMLAEAGIDVGGANDSMIFSGTISGFGVIQKNGTGTLTLAGANTYNGKTVVNEGTLLTYSSGGFATGRGQVNVYGGTLGGTGYINGTTTLSARRGGTPILSPGIDGPGRIHFGGAVIFQAGATYQCELNSDTGQVDTFIAYTVSINSGATFSFVDLGNTALPSGTVLTVIKKRSPHAFIGTFGNLPDGSTFTVGNNTFQASYEGGPNGRDLTLTVQ
jgi:autotransporter-associated beta strand protein